MIGHTLRATTALTCLIAAAPVVAQVSSFNIPPQDMGNALTMIGKQADVQIVSSRDDTGGKRSNGVKGEMTVADALQRIVAGTGLEAHPRDAKTYSIVRAGAEQGGNGPLSASEDANRPPTNSQVEDIIVSGIRASLQTAQTKKRDAVQIVDSIVADDIGKLPDVNVAEALQRITGVQITRNKGAGSGIQIRGLTQIRTELDGRSIFTASGGRNLSLEDIPSELLAGADVYKSPSADLIEGGIGGLVNLRLRKPLDFDGFHAAGQVRANTYDLHDKVTPSASGLVTDRWDVGGGELGVLLAGSYQKEAFTTFDDTSGNTTRRADVYDYNKNGFIGSTAAGTTEAGDAITIPLGAGYGVEDGTRERIGANAALQWRPTDNLEIYADGLYQRYKIKANDVLLFVTDLGTGPNPAQPIELFSGSDIVQKASWLNSTVDSNAFTGDRTSTTWQAAGGAKWHNDRLKLGVDGSYTKSKTFSNFYQLAFGTVAPVFTQDLTGKYPSFSIGGIDLTNPSSYSLNRASQYIDRERGVEKAGRADAEYDFDGFLSSIKIGLRYTDRTAYSGTAYVYNNLTAFKATDFPASIFRYSLGDLYTSRGYTANLPRDIIAPPISLIRDFDQIRAFAGDPPGTPSPTPQSTFRLIEKTFGGYAVASFKTEVGGIKISGNAGARVIQTKESTDGTIQNPDGSFGPLSVGAKYTDVLPQGNIKIDVTPKLVVRFAAAKTITRPDFSQLSPSLSLDYLFHSGGAGNPALAPIRAKQADVSVEYYLTGSSLVYAAGFLKNVDGFISNIATFESIPGQSQQFLISRPANGGSGKIRGVEVGWNQFLTFLPAPFDGLGFQANYTYVYSKGPSPLSGVSVPLIGLSKNSYNLVGIYEKGPISVRLAYNWRDKYINSIIAAGTISPTFIAPTGYLDGSINFDLSKNLTIFADAANLTHTYTQAYVVDKRSKQDGGFANRRISFGIRAKL